jgi:hypothetical protein
MEASRPARAIRVVRALAFLVSGAATGCGDDGTATPPDVAVDALSKDDVEVAASEAASNADDTASSANDAEVTNEGGGETLAADHACVEVNESVVCPKGSVCNIGTYYGELRCDATAPGLNKPCGDILCGWLCSCEDALASVCRCYSDAGPLPPPNMPRANRAVA